MKICTTALDLEQHHCSVLGQACVQGDERLDSVYHPAALPSWVARAKAHLSLQHPPNLILL